MSGLSLLKKRPDWLKIRLSSSRCPDQVSQLVNKLKLDTVCRQAACPNLNFCWGRKQAGFMLLGKNCTRSCRFCNVGHRKPDGVLKTEPLNIARAVKELGLLYVVITSVTRDDLPDGGLQSFKQTVEYLNKLCSLTKIELLIPDFFYKEDLIRDVALMPVSVIGHNIETVGALYSRLRPGFFYQKSLGLLKLIKSTNPAVITKSAILLGMGESFKQVIKTLKDLRSAEVDIVYFCQYLSPSPKHERIKKYYSPDEFENFKEISLSLGFRAVVSEPLARSSFKAHDSFLMAKS